MVSEAPLITEYLSTDAERHFDRVASGLKALNIPFALEPKLVRGLDYYTHTTFEFQSLALENAQNTVCGGGRYNGLVEQLGGPATPGIGFALGIERLLLACDAEGSFPSPPTTTEVWVIDVTDGSSARDLTNSLREAGIAADRSFDQRSMRSQMRSADRSGAAIALIVGEQELSESVVTLRKLRDDEADQISIPRSDIVNEVRLILGLES